jgi:hypothetical protein
MGASSGKRKVGGAVRVRRSKRATKARISRGVSNGNGRAGVRKKKVSKKKVTGQRKKKVSKKKQSARR